MIKVIAKMTLKPGMVDEMKKIADKLVVETRKEAGCVSYELYQDIKNPDMVCFVEEWQSNEALKQHVKSPHFKEAMSKINEILAKEPEMNVCSLLI